MTTLPPDRGCDARRAGVILAAGALAILCAAVAAPPADLSRQFLRFLGRMHPMVVHFPIALLIAAAVFECLSGRRAELRQSARACLYLAALTAVPSVFMGWFHAALEPHGRAEARALEVHRWTGIATAAATIVASLLALVDARSTTPLRRTAYRYGLFAAVLLVAFTGHVGGALVYGEDYALRAFDAWRKKPARAPEDPVEAGDAPRGQGDPTPGEGTGGSSGDADPPKPAADERSGDVDFERDIRPIFETHCYECHGPDKQEGDLALHEREGAFGEDPTYWTIIPGRPEESLLLEMIQLPPDDPDFMPSERDPLSPAEIARIRRWIEQGAPWPD